jgi:hypothetical protein
MVLVSSSMVPYFYTVQYDVLYIPYVESTLRTVQYTVRTVDKST